MKLIYRLVPALALLISFPHKSGATTPDSKYSGKDIKEVLKKSYTAITGLQSLSYDVTHLSKSYTNNDTIMSHASCLLRCSPSVELHAMFTLNIQYDVNETKMVKYNGQYATIYYAKDGNAESTKINIDKEGFNWFNGTNIRDYVYNHIINSKDLKRVNNIIYKPFIESISMTDTLLSGLSCYHVVVKTKNSNRANAVKNSITEWTIDKNTYLPLAYCISGTFEDIDMYDQYTFHIKAVNPELSDTVFNGEITGLPAEPVAVIPVAATENTSNATRDADMTVLPIPIINDDTITLSKYKGKVVVLDFWYRTCLPCLQLMPDIDKLSGEYKKEDVLILGINDIDSKETVAKYFSYKGYHYLSSYKNEHNISSLANIKENPTTVIIGKQGEVVQKIIGYDRGSYKEIKRAIEKELKGN